MKKFLLSLSVILSFLSAAWLYCYYMPSGVNPEFPAGYKPVRNDFIAEKFLPVIISDGEYQPIEKILYRAAEDSAGNIFIAYHPVWKFERNSGNGIMPFLNRVLYTGGMSLQKTMFGKGDVENIVLKIDRAGHPVEMVYETAENYSVKNFSVKHKRIILPLSDGKIPVLKVISWNHLFTVSGEFTSTSPAVKPEYFTDELWQEYEMTKYPPTRILKNRAHEKWEIPQSNNL